MSGYGAVAPRARGDTGIDGAAPLDRPSMVVVFSLTLLRRRPSGRHGGGAQSSPGPSQTVSVGLALVAAVVLVLAAALVSRLSADSGRGSYTHDVIDEGFEHRSLDESLWSTCYWWECTIRSNKELEWYTSTQVALDDGHLFLTANDMPVKTPGGETFRYRSGMISTGPAHRDGPAKFSFTYGTVEARLRVPAGRGLWSALWMLPTAGGSRPEVDILEVLGHDTRTGYQSLHREDRSAKPFEHAERGTDLAVGWHVYGLEWMPGRLRWYIDDQLVFSIRGKEVPDQPMYLIANLAVGGTWPGSPDASTRFPSSMLIDYIEVRPGVR
jgi:beta-glucanase (GH16 family)